jgi:hypothetical protein
MPDPLQRFVSSRTLWVMVATPLFGFLWHLAACLRRSSQPRPGRWARGIGVGCVALSSVVAALHVLKLAQEPVASRALWQHLGSSVRVGPFAAGFDLLLDPLSGVACSLACLVALASAAVVASRPPSERGWSVWAWLELALGAAMLSFLAGGLLTVFLGWGLAAASGAWLAGWADRRVGAVRATRGALGIVALIIGALLLSQQSVQSVLTFPELAAQFADPATVHTDDGLALVAFLIAASAMSSSTPPAGAPLALVAVACGATTSALGPLLLLRLAFLIPLVTPAGSLVVMAGALMVVLAGRRALFAPKGPMRWLSLVAGAPAGLTYISLGRDGASGALVVLASAGLVAALLMLTAARRGVSADEGATWAPASLDDLLLADGLERAGAFLMTFEHWVVDAIVGAIGVLLHASGWALARFDTVVIGAPADAWAEQAVRLGRRAEPSVGGSLARIAWVVVTVFGLVAIAHALWPVR